VGGVGTPGARAGGGAGGGAGGNGRATPAQRPHDDQGRVAQEINNVFIFKMCVFKIHTIDQKGRKEKFFSLLLTCCVYREGQA
jgi:hypothetical protein